jgi:hypothetical protein
MIAQVDLEVMCKRSKKKEYHLIFINVGVRSSLGKIPQRENFDV